MNGSGGPRPGIGSVRAVRRGGLTVTRLHRGGLTPHRFLLLGGRRLLQPARRPPAEALGERIADRVWLRSQRGVDIDMVWELRAALTLMARDLSAWRLWRYDAVIVLVDTSAGSRHRWGRRGLRRLLKPLVRDGGGAGRVVLVHAGQGQGRRSASRTESSASRRKPAVDGQVTMLFVTSDTASNADAIALHLLEPLISTPAGTGSNGWQRHTQRDEVARQTAVTRVRPYELQIEDRLQHVVDLAKEAFETASAEITIIDDDRQWTIAAAGVRQPDLPRATSLCNRSIQQPSSTLIADTWQVPDLSGNPNITGRDAIRFYAAWPIESLEGYRIGVLCVWDRVPHDAEEFDLAALRDLALLAEAEIISAASS